MNEKMKLFNEFMLKNASVSSRRHFLKNCTLGLSGMAFTNFLMSCSNDKNNVFDNSRTLNPLAPISPPNLGKVKSVITLIFHLEQNAIDAENPNQAVEATAETADHAETTVKDEIIEVAAETVDHAETTVLEEREVHEENADHAERVDQAGIVVEVTESVDQEEKEAVAKSETQPFVNSVALGVNHLVMRTTEDPNPLILVH